MALEDGVREFRHDEWTLDRGVMLHGLLGVVLRHIYSVPFDGDLETLALSEGDPMPNRPSSGVGSTATISSVRKGLKDGTSRQQVIVTGFESKGYS